MNKYINLRSLYDVFNNGTTNLIDSFRKVADSGYENHRNEQLDELELEDLYSLTEKVIDVMSSGQSDGYFLNFKIEHGMRQEFDVLRFSEDSVLNIELKSDIPDSGFEGIKDQLINHRHILKLLDLDIYLFTYVSKTETMYMLKDKELQKLNALDIINYIDNDFKSVNPLLYTDMNEMIISPYTEPEKFISHTYFLNDTQANVKRKILKDLSSIITIKGGPGTGKSLLLMDLAQVYHDAEKKVLVFVSGILRNYEEIKNAFDFTVIGTQHMGKVNPEAFDIILVDESQRLYTETRDYLLKLSQEIKVVFAIDQNQAIHEAEIARNNISKILEHSREPSYELGDAVRTNLSISTFIQKFLKINTPKLQPMEFPNVNIVYFNNRSNASSYLRYLTNQDFISIELNEYLTKSTKSLKRESVSRFSLPVHNVTGQEYDNVVVTLDNHFIYNEDGELTSDYNEYYPYNENRAIYQSLTRVRKKLVILVYDNPELYIKLQKILTWAQDTLQKEKDLEYFDYGFHTNKNSVNKLLQKLELDNKKELKKLLEDDSDYQINISLGTLIKHLGL